MDVVMDAANTTPPLDYIEFLISPTHNRYEAWVCYANVKEKVTSGILEHLLHHSAEIKTLHSKGSDAEYKLKSPGNSDHVKWFTKATLIRFLHIIGSDVTNSLKTEISQLEEARKFHLSLYAKGTEYQQPSGKADASKNELLRAIDLRLTALREELSTAFDQTVGSKYSFEEMIDVEKFSHHFGSEDLRASLQKHLELRRRTQAVENHTSRRIPESDRVGQKEGNNHATKPLSSETQVKYGVSPAKAAQVERQSSTESDESSMSSEEEQPSVERSRTLVRSASPRRSASPMRRVQIGRSGSRRSTAITIKSLNYFPARDKSFFPKEDDSDEEVSVQALKRPEINVTRMSVQDAISLFENKQKDKPVDSSQKAKLNASISANKAVLRRWSSGMSEDPSAAEIQNTVESEDVEERPPESIVEPRVADTDNPIGSCELDGQANSSEKRAVSEEETIPNGPTDVSEKLAASAEWSRQKEAELNELLMRMMETKPVKSRTAAVPNGSKRQSLPAEKRGGFYDNYKEKRDEKLRGEALRNRAEKDKEFKPMQQILGAKKSQLTSAKASDTVKKNNVKKLQKPQKNVAQPIINNSKTESPKVGVVKKSSPRPSSLPATRRSLPSMPSPRDPGASPAKTPVATPASTGAKPSRRRSQPTPPISQSSPKVEPSQPRVKSVRSSQQDSMKSARSATEKKQQPVARPSKTVKSKIQPTAEGPTSTAKPMKITKKSSVVPVESKPFLRKGAGTISNANLSVKKKALTISQESLRKSEDNFPAEISETFSSSPVPVILQEEGENDDLQIPESPQKCEDKVEALSKVEPVIDTSVYTLEERESKDEDEDQISISPTAWVEVDDHEEDQHVITSDDRICQMVGSPPYAAPVGESNSRVRHSLSQMLLDEPSEPDIVDWGNAENPPVMIYQKDAPKGFKRLLKFARKSKTDGNSSGWSSPSVVSEGEDDNEDSKTVNRRNSENLLKKATLQSMNNGHQKATNEAYPRNVIYYERTAEANMNKVNVKSLSQQIMEGHASSSVTTTKATTRSFFSLSAFKGSK